MWVDYEPSGPRANTIYVGRGGKVHISAKIWGKYCPLLTFAIKVNKDARKIAFAASTKGEFTLTETKTGYESRALWKAIRSLEPEGNFHVAIEHDPEMPDWFVLRLPQRPEAAETPVEWAPQYAHMYTYVDHFNPVKRGESEPVKGSLGDAERHIRANIERAEREKKAT